MWDCTKYILPKKTNLLFAEKDQQKHAWVSVCDSTPQSQTSMSNIRILAQLPIPKEGKLMRKTLRNRKKESDEQH